MKNLSLSESARIIDAGIQRIIREGYVVSGEIQIHDPPDPKVHSVSEAVVGPRLAVLTVKTVPREHGTVAVSVRPREPLPPVAIPTPDVRTVAVALAATLPAPSGNLCWKCGSPDLFRSGTCETCRTCGETSGCG